MIAVGSVLVAAMAGVTVYALSQRTEARDQAREARAHQLEAESAAGLLLDPERSLLLAREAARLYPSETAEEALRTALIQSRVRTVVDVGEPLLGAVLNGDERSGGDGLGVAVRGRRQHRRDVEHDRDRRAGSAGLVRRERRRTLHR